MAYSVIKNEADCNNTYKHATIKNYSNEKDFSILIAMFIVNIASMAQEQVFSIGTNGDIVTKTKFIEELYSGNYNNVTPYALKFSERLMQHHTSPSITT